jgi:hypothetical protein
VAHRADHEEQAKCVTYEPRHTDQYSTDQDDQSVEYLPGGHLSPLQAIPGMSKNAESDTADDKWSECAHYDQQPEGPEESNPLGNDDESGDLGDNGQQQAD